MPLVEKRIFNNAVKKEALDSVLEVRFRTASHFIISSVVTEKQKICEISFEAAAVAVDVSFTRRLARI